MKNLALIILVSLFLIGCGGIGPQTQYPTIDHKDVSLRVRTFWADVDYDSRVVTVPEPIYPLDPLDPLKGIKPSSLDPIEPLNPLN